MFLKIPPGRRFHFSASFIIREAEVITSFYQVTAMEQLDTLIFDAIIKLRNNKKRPNENSIYTLISKDCKSLSKMQLEERLLTLTTENKFVNCHSARKNSYFTVSDDNTDDLSINNGLLTIESVKEIFMEIFKEQQNALVNIVSQNTTPLQTSLDKLTMENKDSNDRLNNIMEESDDLKLSMETYQNIIDDKLKDAENSIHKIKETFKREIEKLQKDNDDTNNKARILEDCSRQDNLRFDGIEEWEEESWADTEQNLKSTLGEILGIQTIKIERAHHVGDKKRSPCRTMVAKLSSFKIKKRVLTEAKKRKHKGIQIYEDFSKATAEIQKKNWEKV